MKRSWCLDKGVYSQLLQHLEFTLHLRGSVGIVSKTVYENLRRRGVLQLSVTSPDTHPRAGASSCLPLPPHPPAGPPHLDVLAVLLLGLILSLLAEQPLLLALDEGFKVPSIAVQPLAVQVDDVCGNGIQEVAVMRDN